MTLKHEVSVPSRIFLAPNCPLFSLTPCARQLLFLRPSIFLFTSVIDPLLLLFFRRSFALSRLVIQLLKFDFWPSPRQWIAHIATVSRYILPSPNTITTLPI